MSQKIPIVSYKLFKRLCIVPNIHNYVDIANVVGKHDTFTLLKLEIGHQN